METKNVSIIYSVKNILLKNESKLKAFLQK